MNSNSKQTINLITLGCAKNIVDSEHLAATLDPTQWEIRFDHDDPADVVIINTCGFILDAKEESIETILSAAALRKNGQIKQLFVFGCLSQRYADELRAEMPEVDEFFGARTIEDIVAKLKGDNDIKTDRILTTPKHYAYLKISEGCNWGCGYCAIPLIRGKHISVPMEELLEEATKLAQNGVKELMVIAQDTTYYGMDLYGERKLGELLRKLCQISGLEWIRLHYAYPTTFPDDVIEIMANEPKMCKYLDIPLQHITDNMLSSMRRGLTQKETEELIEKLRTKIPGIAIRTTMLVGYPGETAEDIEALKEFMKKARFEKLGVFPYSAEEGTHSYLKLEDNLTDEEKQNRADEIMALQQNISESICEKRIGMTARVIVDKEQDDFVVCRAEWDSPEVDGEVFVPKSSFENNAEGVIPGQFINVKITSADLYDLYADKI